MKKLITLLLAFCMTVSPFSAFAAIGTDTYDTQTAPGWSIRSLDSDSWGSLDYETKRSGSCAIHLVNKTPEQPRKFLTMGTTVDLEAGKRYKFGFSAKFTNIEKGRIDFADVNYSISRYGSASEWTDYEFTYDCKTARGQASVMFAFDGVCEVWIDDVFVYEAGKEGTNMIKNPGFETAGTQKEPESATSGVTASIAGADKFSVADFKKELATIGYIPVYKLSGYSVDCFYDEWGEALPMTIPASEKQKVQYLASSVLDVTCDVKLGYDEENFYIALKVFDPVHYAFNNANYWTADSIQLAITGAEDPFGNETGFVHDEEKQTYGIFSGFADSVNASIGVATKRDGEYTYYDIAFPWNAIFKERPDEIKLDILVNDNDGQGRIGGIDFSGGGIHQTKNNINFPVLRLMEEGGDYFGWIQGPTEVDLNAEEEYNLYLINDGEEREFTVSIPEAGFSESFTVAANTGIKRKMVLTFPESGKRQMIAEIRCGEKSYISQKTVTVSRSFAQLQDFYHENYPKIEAYHKELVALVQQCKNQNMPTDYLDVGEAILGRFLEWMQEDYQAEELGELEHMIYALTNIYNETKALAEGYLDGSIEPQYVPRFVSSDLSVEGGQFYADVDNHGKIEKSPVNFVGYLTWFYLLKKDFPFLKKMGNNVVHTEVRMYDLLKTPDINSYWKVTEGLWHPIESTLSEDVVKSGKYALKVVDPAEKWTQNSYRYIHQTVHTKPNTTYSFGLSAKGENVVNAWFTASDYTNRISLQNTYDWKSFSGTYTTGENQTELTLKIYTEAKADALYLDDIYICESGSTENLLKDPGFESGECFEGVDYTINYDYLEEIRENFRKAEENDIRIDLLLAGHNMPKFLTNYPELKYTGGGFYPYNMNADLIKELYEVYIRTLIPAVADYKSFGSVCLTNEPAFNATDASVSDFYHDDWVAFLKERFHNDLDALNQAFELECASFEEVPMRGGKTYSAFEFARKEFADKIFADWHQWAADLVKECAPHALIHSKKMNEVGRADYARARNQALIGTDTEKWTTFSDINGLDATGHIYRVDSENDEGSLNGADFEHEFAYYDLSRSVKNMPVHNSEDHVFGGYTLALGEVVEEGNNNITVDETSDSVALNMWSGALHGRGASTIWIFEREDRARARQHKYYTQWVTLYPDILYKTGKISLDLQRLAYEVKALQDQPAEAGIMFAQSGRIMNNSVMNAVYNTYSALMYNGQRTHFVTESTPETMHNLRLLFIPNLKNVKPVVMQELKKFVDNGGKLVVLGKDCLAYDEHNVPYPQEERDYILSRSQVIDVTADGIYLTYPNKKEMTELTTDILKDAGLNRIQLVDAKTNEPIYNTDYYATTYNGKLLIQIAYYTSIKDGEKEIKVLLNGEPIGEMKDILNNKTYQQSFTMKPISAVLLEVETDNRFLDTYGHWAEQEIVDMTGREIVHGVSETMFMPEKRITRAEFTALLVRMLGIEPASENLFADINSADWFAGEVNAAAKAGLTAKADGVFDANAAIPREEMAYMLKKAYELKVGTAQGTAKVFTDSNFVGAEFKEAVDFVSGLGLISGYEDGSFRPQGKLSRAEAVKVLSKLFEVMI